MGSSGRGVKVKMQITEQVMLQIWSQIVQLLPDHSDEIRDQIFSQVRDIKVCNEIWWKVGTETCNQVRYQVGDHIRDHMNPLYYVK